MAFGIFIPENISKEAENYFSKAIVNNARKIIEKSGLNVSFQKGSLDNYFIISGIVDDGEKRRSKVSFKNKTNKLTTSCNCSQWNEDQLCPHTAALFIKFHMNFKAKAVETPSDTLNPELSIHSGGVHAREYGEIIHSPRDLNGARTNSTYSSIQYLLTNNKLTYLPAATKNLFKVNIDFVFANTKDKWKSFPNSDLSLVPTFTLEEGDSTFKKISLFEYFYIFNWQTGELYQQPTELIDIVKSILREGEVRNSNQYYQLVKPYLDCPHLQISFNGKRIQDINQVTPSFEISLLPSSKKSYIDCHIQLNYDGIAFGFPSEVEIFALTNGLLDSFRTKTESYIFLRKLLNLHPDDNDYKKHLFNSSKRKKISSFISQLIDHDEVSYLEENLESVVHVSSRFLLEIFKTFFVAFGETFTRFSGISEDRKTITYQIGKRSVLDGVETLWQVMKKNGHRLLYDNKEVRSWSSNIRFERKNSNLNWFDLNMCLDAKDYNIIEKAQVGQKSVLSEEGLVIIENSEALRFMKKYTQYEGSQLEEASDENTRVLSLRFKRARIFELFELKKIGIEGALTKEEEALCEKLTNLKSLPEYQVPSNLVGVPRDYQVTGYRWLNFLYEYRLGACLADDMGLGKTLQTIAFLQSIYDQVDKVLVVCPVSIIINWEQEIRKFSNLDVAIYYGPDRVRPSNDAKIILTSYGVMKKEAYTTFEDIEFDVLVLDEVQQLKNVRSLGAKAARHIKANFRVCLTGTPVENDLSEFYNILDLSLPGIWGGQSFFSSKSQKKQSLMARKTAKPFILRRTKQQVLTELPEKIENHVYLNFSTHEKEFYLEELGKIRQKIAEAQKGRKYTEVLKSLLRLRQLCLWQAEKSFQSTKINFLIKNLETLLEEGHKVIVFSQFTTYLDHIQNKIKEQSWKTARIDGSQSFKKRQGEIDKFQEGDAEVFLISLKAGGVGLNLTAASYIFLMDPWWNPAVESQAIDRAYRIGQKNKLTVYRPIIKDSVEEKVIDLQNSKRKLFSELMAEDDDEYFSGKLSMDDFQFLLS